MKAVVMAGGEGSRLRPLTVQRPKPLVPVVNKPVMQHILELLKRHGIYDIVVTLHYMAEEIEAFFGDGSEFDVNIAYTVEETPLGTAGSVKKAHDLLRDDTFLIISGDALTDINLTEFLRYHRQREAEATLCLVRVESPLEYGVVITDAEGRVRRFLEKPEWSEVFSDTVNTGIYCLEPSVLDYMEPDKVYDWSGDIFPRMLKERRPLYGYQASGYWCDIGGLTQYRQAQSDALSGRVEVEMPGVRQGGDLIWVGHGTEVEADVKIQEPVVIGANCRIKRGAVIEEFSVIGDNCIIGAGSRVIGGVIYNGTYVGDAARATACVIGENCILSRGTVVEEGAVVGDRAHLHQNSSVATRVKIWPDKIIEAGSHVASTFVWGPMWSSPLFKDNRVIGLANVEITPEFGTKLATAFGAFLGKGKTVVISRDSHPASRMIKRAMISGLMSAGISVQDLRVVPKPVISYTLNQMGVTGGIHVHMSTDDPQLIAIEFFNSEGVPFGKALQRKIENIYVREDFRRADYTEVGKLEYRQSTIDAYTDGLIDFVNRNQVISRKFQIVADCAYGGASLAVPPVLGRLGCDLVTLNGFPDATKQEQARAERHAYLQALSTIVPTLGADLGILIEADGEELHLVDERGVPIDDVMALAVFCLLAFQARQGAVVAVPVTAPSVIEEMASHYGGKVIRTKSDYVSLMERAVLGKEEIAFAGDVGGRYIIPRFQPASDAIVSLAWLLEMLSLQKADLSELTQRVPRFSVGHQAVPCPWDRKGEIMRLLTEAVQSEPAEFIDGIKVRMKHGWVLVKPDATEPSFHVHAQAESPEKAEELIASYRDKIQALCNDL
jgi:mannose-1-phosphate guanylyltransferase/phosphomannomutase